MPPSRKRQRRTTEFPTIRFHGNYCGPGWSDGRFQPSVRGYSPAIDDFDQTCKEHDAVYSDPRADRKEADYEFFRKNVGRGVKRTVAAIAVGAQGLLRSSQKKGDNPPTPEKTPQKKSPTGDTMRTRNMSVSSVLSDSGFNRRDLESNLGGSFNKTPLTDSLFKEIAKSSSGVTYQRETKFTSSGADITWFGHATFDYSEVFEKMCYSLVKLLLSKAGISFSGWDDVIGTQLTDAAIRLKWNADMNTTTQSSQDTAAFTAVNTYGTVAIALRDLIATQLTNPVGSSALVEKQFYELALVKACAKVGGAANTEFFLSQIRMDGLEMYVVTQSRLAVQNATLASNADADNDLRDNVQACPLTGRIYEFSGTYAKKVSRNREPAQQNSVGFYLSTVPASNPTGVSAFSEPVDTYQFYGCKKARSVNLDAGQIKTDQVTTVMNINVRRYLNSYSQKIQNVYPHNYGSFHLFALERKVNISTTNSISIYCNQDIRMGIMVREKRNYVQPPLVLHA